MPKKAQSEEVDPVRSRLASAAAGTAERVSAPERGEVPGTSAPRSTAKPRRAAPPAKAKAPAKPDKSSPLQATVNRKFMVSEQEADRMEEVTLSVSRAFGGKVPHTKISRVLWTILGDMEERIKRVKPAESRRAPSTGDSDAQAEYEVALYEFLSDFFNRNR